MLWYAFKFVSLKYQIHLRHQYVNEADCCDLLLNLYLWNIKYTGGQVKKQVSLVVICFWICIFEISNTPYKELVAMRGKLWFAFEFVSLKYQIHPWLHPKPTNPRCDLLLNLYLWNIKYTSVATFFASQVVVICFWICIFEISNTPVPF